MTTAFITHAEISDYFQVTNIGSVKVHAVLSQILFTIDLMECLQHRVCVISTETKRKTRQNPEQKAGFKA